MQAANPFGAQALCQASRLATANAKALQAYAETASKEQKCAIVMSAVGQ